MYGSATAHLHEVWRALMFAQKGRNQIGYSGRQKKGLTKDRRCKLRPEEDAFDLLSHFRIQHSVNLIDHQKFYPSWRHLKTQLQLMSIRMFDRLYWWLTIFCVNASNRRPEVATRMCTCFLSSDRTYAVSNAPYNANALRPVPRHNRSAVSQIWRMSSRVGPMITTSGCTGPDAFLQFFAVFGSNKRLSMMGIRKAA